MNRSGMFDKPLILKHGNSNHWYKMWKLENGNIGWIRYWEYQGNHGQETVHGPVKEIKLLFDAENFVRALVNQGFRF